MLVNLRALCLLGLIIIIPGCAAHSFDHSTPVFSAAVHHIDTATDSSEITNTPFEYYISSSHGHRLCCMRHSDGYVVRGTIYVLVTVPYNATTKINFLTMNSNGVELWVATVRQTSFVSISMDSSDQLLFVLSPDGMVEVPLWLDVPNMNLWLPQSSWPISTGSIVGNREVVP